MFGWFKQRRRKRILAEAPSPQWQTYIERNVRHWAYLDDAGRARLWQRLRIMVAEKDWAGGAGFHVTDEMKVTIAAQASVMLLGIDAEYYFDSLRTIIVYPGAYVRPDQPWYSSDDEQDEDDPLLGESWHRGPVVVSWKSVLRAGRNAARGMNVVFHEFAHFLDGLDGAVEGTPPLAPGAQARRWYRVTEAEYLRLVGNAQRGEATILDHYGATNLAEFFAVSTECFFERPRALRQWHRELYDVLADFYHQDPAAWLADAESTAPPQPRRRSPRQPPWPASERLQSADDYYTRGIAQLNDENYPSAVADFSEALRLTPDDGEALVHRAIARLNLDDLAGALEDCERALRVDSNDIEALRMRGSVRLELGQLDGAIADLDRVVADLPGDLDARFLRGRALLLLPDPRRALADLDKALVLDPHDAEAYAYRGRALELLGRLDEAQADYHRARQIEPELEIDFS